MYHKFLFTQLAIGLAFLCPFASSAQLTLSPNPLANAQCPGVPIIYTINGWSQSCTATSVTLTNATVESIPISVSASGAATFPVTWLDNGMQGSLKIALSNNCNGLTITVPILTLVGVAPPVISGPISLPAGTSGVLPIAYTASQNYPFRGTADPDPFRVRNFSWDITPSSWSFTTAASSPAGTNSTIDVVPNVNPSTAATISAAGLLPPTCGTTSTSSSSTGSILVGRTVPTPVVNSSLTLDSVICGSTKPFLVNIINTSAYNSLAGVVTYTFATATPGWTIFQIDPTLPFAVVTPNGTTGGSVGVTVYVDGIASSTFSFNLPLSVVVPGTVLATTISGTLNGLPLLCESGDFHFEPGLPAGVTATWEIIMISPVGGTIPVTPSSGTGEVANLSRIGSLSGKCLIRFTIGNDVCGRITRSRTFMVGSLIQNGQVNGNQLNTINFICNKLTSHWMNVVPVNDADNCVDSFTVTGTTNYYTNCTHVNFTIPQNSTSNVAITATISNACGQVSKNYTFIPVPYGCPGLQYGMAIHPNPATQSTTIQMFEAGDGEEAEPKPVVIDEIYVMGFGGQIIETRRCGEETVTLDLSGYKPGRYYVKAISGKNTTVQPFVVNRD